MKIVCVNNDTNNFTINRVYDAEIEELEILYGFITVYRIDDSPWKGTYSMKDFKPLRQVKLEKIIKEI